MTLEIQQLRDFELDVMGRRPDPIDELAEKVRDDPSDLKARLRLYVAHILARGGDTSDARVFVPHLLHFVKHAPFLRCSSSKGVVSPDDPEHGQLRALWSSTLASHRDEWTLHNAVAFYSDFDDEATRALARELLAVAPNASHARLKHAAVELADCERGMASASYQRVLDVTLSERLPDGRLAAPDAAAIAAYELGHDDLARECAAAALAWESQGTHDMEQVGATVMGLLALRAGDDESAVVWLERSSAYVLDQAGPSLRLARELARRGRGEVVRTFLAEVKTRWDGRSSKCDDWMAALEAGRVELLRNPSR